MAGLFVILVIAGCATYLYLKGTLVRAFAALMAALCADVIAFGYFEPLAKTFVDSNILLSWAQPLSFILLFILSLAILLVVVFQLTRAGEGGVDLGLMPERIGRVVVGILLGFVIAGSLLAALATAPMANDHPYQRFDRIINPDADKSPRKSLLNADGFAAGWFSVVSRGGLSGERSFAMIHPDFITQAFLNRHPATDEISVITKSGIIDVPAKKAAWPAPEGLKDTDGRPIPSKSGHQLTVVRVGLKQDFSYGGYQFTFSQLKLVCKQKEDVKNPFAGKGINVYPVGYLKTPTLLQMKKLSDKIVTDPADYTDGIRWIDFAFYVPDDFVPVLAELKQNSIAQIPPPVTADQAPPAISFILASECATDIAALNPLVSDKLYGIELTADKKLLDGLTLAISDPNRWLDVQTPASIKPAQFENKKIIAVRADLRIKTLTPQQMQDPNQQRELWKKGDGLQVTLKPVKGYKLLSLKCNNPSVGAAINGRQLPVLVELSGSIDNPVGVVVGGKINNQFVYEVDYCAVTDPNKPDCLALAEDGSVAKPFPDAVWLPEQAQSINEFYVLYLVKEGKNTVILSVKSPDSQTAASLKERTGFLIK